MIAKKRALLIVDDEPDLREILCFFFERKGYAIFQAENAVEGIKIVKSNKIDAIISDIRMPGGDGVQLLDSVKKYDLGIPMILFVTGFTDITFEEAYDKGCEAIFSKPFNTNILADTIEKLVQREERWKISRPLRADATFQINISHQGLPEAQGAQGLNIGRGGFFVRARDNFPKVGDTLSFRITLDKEIVTVIEGEGIVRWVRLEETKELASGYGVEFDQLDEKTRAKVFEFINFLKTTQYIPKN